MNKQELINHIKDQNEWSGNHRFILIKKEELIFMIEDLDEPQKVKVPAFVADWIEEVKQRGCGLADALDCFASPIMPDIIKEWLEFNSSVIGCHHDHQELLARAWLDGYEVEEEPKYYVKEPITGQFLVRDEAQSNGVKWVDGFSTHPSYYTEAEIEAIEPSYLLFKVPVEKV